MKTTLKNRKKPKIYDTVNRSVNALILFTSVSGLLVLAFSVNRIFEYLNTGLPTDFYLVTSFAGLAWASGFLFCLRLSQQSKQKLLLLTYSTLTPIWATEVYLSITPESDHGNTLIPEWATDQRSKIQVIYDLRSQGANAYPNVSGSAFTKTNGVPDSGRSSNLFPIGSISNQITVYCNESGYWSIFHSDEHGFNNPLGNYRVDNVDIVLTGDSFTEGACVKPTETIAANLRNEGLRVISLGKGGNGPLLQFASYVEYAKPMRPKVVVWIHYANDLHDLEFKELGSSKLREYLEDEDYSQGLNHLQPEIDATLKRYVAAEYAAKVLAVTQKLPSENSRTRVNNQEQAQPRKKINVVELIKLTRLRELLDLRPSRPNPASPTSSAYRIILQRVKDSTDSWNGHLYLAYLPPYERYQTGKDHDVFYRDFVFRIAKELNIPVIDLHEKVFNIHPDPLALFPRRKARHYNSEGYRLVAKAIRSRLTQDEISW